MAGGRPSKYKPEYIQLVENYARLGATEAQMHDYFDVDQKTFDLWKKRNPEFLLALKAGKDYYNTLAIEASLAKSAAGFSIESEKIFCTKDGSIVRAPYTEYYPPNPTSMIFWLKNRDRERWREKQEVEHSGSIRTIQINVRTKVKK